MNTKRVFTLIILGAISLLLYTWWVIYFIEREELFFEVHENNPQYSFINPLLECNPNYDYFNPRSIRKEIEKYILSQEKSENISEVAYYVRLLKNGSTFGYKQNNKFVPASLSKIPFSIVFMKKTWFKDLETIINTPYKPQNNFSWDDIPDAIKIWSEYSLGELLSHMMIHSDNTASLNLFEYFQKIKWPQSYDAFGLWIVDFSTDKSLEISTKDHAWFFRILYNSSFLEREKSEYLLNLLSKSSFKEGLRKKIPSNIQIANKFWANDSNGETYIHDCWIVYTQSPYIICVMTKWESKTKQLEVIQNISKIVYEDIKNEIY